MNLNKYLVIEGNIGVGKTSLSRMFCNRFHGELILERFEDNPFLPLFYKNQERYAFQLELSFMADRYNQIRGISEVLKAKENLVVADFYFIKSLIFASVTLKDEELKLFTKLFNIAQFELVKPDLFIYLYAEPGKLLHNIKKRGRPYEQGISADYLLKVGDSYANYLQKADFPVLYIDVTDSDFVTEKSLFQQIADMVLLESYPVGLTQKKLK